LCFDTILTVFNQLQKDLYKLKNPDKAKILSRFFKTGKGQYGEGDIFLGITVPVQRKVVGKYINLTLKETQRLIESKIHEHRLVAILILVEKYKKAGPGKKKEIVDFYLKNTKNINNWDLVDLSAEKILGEFLLDKNKNLLYRLSKSENLWERRIAILATFQFIKNKNFTDALKIYKLALKDKHDLIQKAVGWMLREIGKRNPEAETEFLNKHYKNMARTTLRYAIERLDEKKKKYYMRK